MRFPFGRACSQACVVVSDAASSICVNESKGRVRRRHVWAPDPGRKSGNLMQPRWLCVRRSQRTTFIAGENTHKQAQRCSETPRATSAFSTDTRIMLILPMPARIAISTCFSRVGLTAQFRPLLATKFGRCGSKVGETWAEFLDVFRHWHNSGKIGPTSAQLRQNCVLPTLANVGPDSAIIGQI